MSSVPGEPDNKGVRQRRVTWEKEPLLHSHDDEREEVMAGCCFAECQAPIQAFLRPGMWVPGLRRLHLFQQEWQIPATIDQCMESFRSAVEFHQEREHLAIHKVDKKNHYIEVFAFTAGCNWLDVVEVRFHPGSDSTTTATARSFSSGFVPACIPFAFVWNIFLFWVPFSGNGVNTRRLNTLREAMQLTVTVTSEETCSCKAP